MLRPGSIAMLAVLAVAGVALVVWTRDQPQAPAGAGEPLFPGLMERVNDVTEIGVTSAEGRFTVSLDAGRWVVAEKSGYPAEAATVRRFLIGVAELSRLEPKTRNPELYAKLDLEDVDVEGAKSTGFVLRDADGAVLAQWLLGKSRPAKVDPERRELYVRLAGDAQTWLAEGVVQADRRAVAWLSQGVLEIDRDRIRRVTVEHADGGEVRVERPDPAENDFELQAVPAGKRVEYPFAVNDLATSFSALRLDDVAAEPTVDFSAPAAKATLLTFDGLRVELERGRRDDEPFVRLTAAFDETAVAAPAAEASSAELSTGSESAGVDAARKSADEVRGEVQTLNARWRGWAYRLPAFRLDSLFKPMAELVSDVEAEATLPGDAAPAGGGS